MMKNNIESELRDWFSKIVTKYTWLNIKFEYDEGRGVFLVSYNFTKNNVASNEFINDAIGFENMMNKKYGDDAPLFCDEEKYFHLSKHAELVNKR